MLVSYLKSKIHQATVTGADINYQGSVTISAKLLEAARIRENERVDIYNITNGNRLTTYAIEDKTREGVIEINGAAARLVNTGDQVIICSYAYYSEEEALKHKPRVVLCNSDNTIKVIK